MQNNRLIRTSLMTTIIITLRYSQQFRNTDDYGEYAFI